MSDIFEAMGAQIPMKSGQILIPIALYLYTLQMNKQEQWYEYKQGPFDLVKKPF